MGTSLEKMSGPVTLGSVGLTGKALTNGAPGENVQCVLFSYFIKVVLYILDVLQLCKVVWNLFILL